MAKIVSVSCSPGSGTIDPTGKKVLRLEKQLTAARAEIERLKENLLAEQQNAAAAWVSSLDWHHAHDQLFDEAVKIRKDRDALRARLDHAARAILQLLRGKISQEQREKFFEEFNAGLAANQQDPDPEFSKILNDHFWDMFELFEEKK